MFIIVIVLSYIMHSNRVHLCLDNPGFLGTQKNRCLFYDGLQKWYLKQLAMKHVHIF